MQTALDIQRRKIRQKSDKLGSKRLGPFEVVEKTGTHTYRLKLPTWMKIHDNINVNRLSPWKGNEINGELPPPPEPEVVEGEERYEVEKILDSRIFGRWKTLQFLVRWKGYHEGYDEWVSEKNIDADEEIENFYKLNPNAPRKISAAIFSSLHWQPIANFTSPEPTDLAWQSGRRQARGRWDIDSKEGGNVVTC